MQKISNCIAWRQLCQRKFLHRSKNGSCHGVFINNRNPFLFFFTVSLRFRIVRAIWMNYQHWPFGIHCSLDLKMFIEPLAFIGHQVWIEQKTFSRYNFQEKINSPVVILQAQNHQTEVLMELLKQCLLFLLILHIFCINLYYFVFCFYFELKLLLNILLKKFLFTYIVIFKIYFSLSFSIQIKSKLHQYKPIP